MKTYIAETYLSKTASPIHRGDIMGTVGKKIAGDVGKTIGLLNKALADEWLAVYQYWVGAKVIEGPMRDAAEAELKEHAEDELKHANMLADRIIQLGGVPLMSPDEIKAASGCGYAAPKDHHVLMILEQNIKGEQCAIATYNKMLKEIGFQNDPITCNMVRKVMEDEVEHEHDLQDLQRDIQLIK